MTDLVRIFDTPMRGIAFGTVVLHAMPESAPGDPPAIVRTGDDIVLDGQCRPLSLSAQDIAARLTEWRRQRPVQRYKREYYQLYVEHALQSDRGCDLDVLVGAGGSTVVRESH